MSSARMHHLCKPLHHMCKPSLYNHPTFIPEIGPVFGTTGFAHSILFNPKCHTMQKFFTLLFLLLLSVPFCTAQIHVDKSATGANTGASWDDAFTDLQDALAIAEAGDTILVAQGIYTPGVDSTATFWIEEDLVLKGGYSSGGMFNDPATYETILTGDLNGDDLENDFVTNSADNAATVVKFGVSITNATLLQGFTIRNGRSDGAIFEDQYGGGVFSRGAPVIRNCRFMQNYASEWGGAFFQAALVGPVLRIENCVFEHNQGKEGGAIHLDFAEFEVDSTEFRNNASQARGGAIFASNFQTGTFHACHFLENTSSTSGGALWGGNTTGIDSISIEINDCTFQNNSAQDEGGGCYIRLYLGGDQFTAQNCLFSNNESGVGGGIRLASAVYTNGSFLIDSCQFIQNQALSGEGGGLFSLLSGGPEITLTHSEFIENAAEFGGGGATIYGSNPGGIKMATISDCLFQSNSAMNFGGLTAGALPGIGGEFLISNCQFLSNQAEVFAGGMDLYSQSPGKTTVENCHFEGNTAGEIGGGIGVATDRPGDWDAVVRNCTLKNNSSPFGAAIGADPFLNTGPLITLEASIRFENCLLTGNQGDYTVAARNTGNLLLLNCTVADNQAIGIGQDSNSVVTLQNTILHNAFAEYGELSDQQATLPSQGGNLIDDATLDAFLDPVLDQSNIADPGFKPGTYEPDEGSPLINAGVNEGVTAMYDLAGNMRMQGFVDIGAYESGYNTATRDLTVWESLMLSPNPAIGEISVSLPEGISGPASVEILDAKGQPVHLQQFLPGSRLHVGDLPAGLYTLKMMAENRVFLGKFVKQ